MREPAEWSEDLHPEQGPQAVAVTRTRRSLAEQLREALDAMVGDGRIVSWESHYGKSGGKAYTVHEQSDYGVFGIDVVYDFTPGEAMEFVNEYGYDVTIGKA